MEPLGSIAEGEWSSLSGMYTTEEADFLAQLLGNYQVPNDLDGNPSTFWPGHESTVNMASVNEGSYYSLDVAYPNSNCFSQGSQGSSYSGGSGSGSVLFPSSSQESYYLSDSLSILVTSSSSMSMDFCLGDATNTSSCLIEGDECFNQEMSDGNGENQSDRSQPELGFPPVKTLQHKRESEMQVTEPATEDKLINNPSKNSKKRTRSTADLNVQKNKKNAKPKKIQKTSSTSNNEQEDTNAGLNRQTSSSCCSDDDSNASQELNGGETSSLCSKGKIALNLNGKTRASRGSATDPQSLYARKRRERINERLRILQNLVPNGTKVDISTMLEEAVQFVKFLQLQIKLLSSDELWMYAPIAFNGMNIGLDHLKVTAPR